MAKKPLEAVKTANLNESLPAIGTGRKMTLKARKDLDRREREVFAMRRDGYTFQEIEDLLYERAQNALEKDGKEIAYFKSVGAIKDAYDRYLMRCPERFDITGRKEQLELAIQRAEDNYKHAIASAKRSTLEEAERARWSDTAGKWFDRLSKLRALTEDNVIINNFTQNNLVINDADLIGKINAVNDNLTVNTPELDAFKSPDTIPPMADVVDAQIVQGEEVDNSEFEEDIQTDMSVEMAQPTADVQHEEIKPKTTLSNISFTL